MTSKGNFVFDTNTLLSAAIRPYIRAWTAFKGCPASKSKIILFFSFYLVFNTAPIRTYLIVFLLSTTYNFVKLSHWVIFYRNCNIFATNNDYQL